MSSAAGRTIKCVSDCDNRQGGSQVAKGTQIVAAQFER